MGVSLKTISIPRMQAGLKRRDQTGKAMTDKTTDTWEKYISIALGMLKEAGVEVVLYDGEIGENTKALFDGEEWGP